GHWGWSRRRRRGGGRGWDRRPVRSGKDLRRRDRALARPRRVARALRGAVLGRAAPGGEPRATARRPSRAREPWGSRRLHSGGGLSLVVLLLAGSGGQQQAARREHPNLGAPDAFIQARASSRRQAVRPGRPAQPVQSSQWRDPFTQDTVEGRAPPELDDSGQRTPEGPVDAGAEGELVSGGDVAQGARPSKANTPVESDEAPVVLPPRLAQQDARIPRDGL